MTFEEAIFDPQRPLSLTPREWMYSVEASLAEEEELTDKAAIRIAKQEEKPEPSDTGLEKVDMGIDQLVQGVELITMGIDQLVQGVELITSGLQDSRMVDLDPKTRKVLEKIKDLVETAISPYLVDIIKESDSLDFNEGE